jgi:hypothetical protein
MIVDVYPGFLTGSVLIIFFGGVRVDHVFWRGPCFVFWAKQKHNTICVGHHYMQANTNNVNHTWAPLRPTGGKDEPSIVFYAEIVTTSQHGTQNVKIHNKTTLKIKNLINTDPAKKHDQHGPRQKTWSTRTPKRCSVRLYLQLVVRGLMCDLRYLCLLAYSGVQHI